MYTRILVPLDGSDFAAQALPYARVIGQATSAEIELFRAVPSLAELMQNAPPGISGGSFDDTGGIQPTAGNSRMEQRYRELRERVQQEMEGLAQPLRGMGLSVSVRLGEGAPAEAIAREADRQENTLIVMTTHGRSGFLRLRSGSVMDRTIHLTSTPALVVRCEEGQPAPEDPRFRCVILPLDGSALSEQAIPHAVAMAKALKTRVEVLQSLSRTSVAAGAPEVGGLQAPENGGGDAAYLHGMAARLRMEGLPQVEATPVQGDAAKSIIGQAESLDGSIVVMSTHGRSGLGRLLRGSVTDEVMRRSGRPVLIVRARQE